MIKQPFERMCLGVGSIQQKKAKFPWKKTKEKVVRYLSLGIHVGRIYLLFEGPTSPLMVGLKTQGGGGWGRVFAEVSVQIIFVFSFI